MSRDENLKLKWDDIKRDLSQKFGGGEVLDLDSIIFLIGVQELGQGFRKFTKDEKINVMHIAICRLLEPFGYYEFDFFDQDGWPHFKQIDQLPRLKPGEQSVLMKEAVVMYFENADKKSDS